MSSTTGALCVSLRSVRTSAAFAAFSQQLAMAVHLHCRGSGCPSISGSGRTRLPATFAATNHRHRAARHQTHALPDTVQQDDKNEESRPSSRGPAGPVPGRMKLEKIERLGEEAWAGVASVDRGGQDNSLSWSIALAAGDTLALLLFAAIGRAGHGESLDLISTGTTALPFIGGFLTTASINGGYGTLARSGHVRQSAMLAAKCWALGVPTGIFLRAAGRGSLPDKAFVIVTIAFTGMLLIGWRTALAAVLPEASSETGSGTGQRHNKQGNPLEFLQLLMSLTKRW